MNSSVRRTLVSAVLLLLGAAAGVGADRLWRTRSGTGVGPEAPLGAKPAAADEDEEPEPAAIVRTATAVQGELRRTVEALGVAAVPPSATSVESWPADVVVARVLVQPGEVVAKDAPVVQVVATGEAELQLAAAQLTLENSTKSLEVAQQRLDRALGTRTELVAAQSTHDEAKQRLDRLKAGLPPADGVLRAHTPGIVGAVRVQPGGTVPAGTPMIEITTEAVVAQIGIDPADLAGIAPGQAFDVRPIDDRAAARWNGTVSLLSHSVNPATRFIDATLTLAGDSLPRPGTPLRARAGLPGATGVIIPRAAIVPDGDEMVVFVIRDGTAVRAPVTIALRGNDRVLLTSGCVAGDHVVVSGQSQIAPGATVRELAAETSPAQPDGGSGADH